MDLHVNILSAVHQETLNRGGKDILKRGPVAVRVPLSMTVIQGVDDIINILPLKVRTLYSVK